MQTITEQDIKDFVSQEKNLPLDLVDKWWDSLGYYVSLAQHEENVRKSIISIGSPSLDMEIGGGIWPRLQVYIAKRTRLDDYKEYEDGINLLATVLCAAIQKNDDVNVLLFCTQDFEKEWIKSLISNPSLRSEEDSKNIIDEDFFASHGDRLTILDDYETANAIREHIEQFHESSLNKKLIIGIVDFDNSFSSVVGSQYWRDCNDKTRNEILIREEREKNRLYAFFDELDKIATSYNVPIVTTTWSPGLDFSGARWKTLNVGDIVKR